MTPEEQAYVHGVQYAIQDREKIAGMKPSGFSMGNLYNYAGVIRKHLKGAGHFFGESRNPTVIAAGLDDHARSISSRFLRDAGRVAARAVKEHPVQAGALLAAELGLSGAAAYGVHKWRQPPPTLMDKIKAKLGIGK